jgi:anionic cell wall polymer biosynthesis LytR-Cps2A-Psr (LCP) family protein
VSEDDELQFCDLLLYHPATKKAGLFYIPANTGSRIESLDRFDKLEVLYGADDTEPLRRKIEQLTDLSVAFTLHMSTEDIGRLVDLIGGVELFISNPVDIETASGRYLLPSGSVLLDGDKIRDYIDYEEPLEEESEKVRRKQKFVGALLQKLGSASTNAFLLDGEVFPYFSASVHTNMNARALQALVGELTRLKADRLLTQGQRVLGTLTNVEGVEGAVLFPHHDGNLMRQTLSQNLASISSEDESYDDTTLISMEILNGTNQDGLAKRTKSLFESFGFEVLAYRNADHDQYLNTVVIDRKGEIQLAERAADVIQCQRVYSRIEDGASVDVTIILGRDFDGRYCK